MTNDPDNPDQEVVRHPRQSFKPKFRDFSERINEFAQSSDRVCAIVWGISIQEALQQALVSTLVTRDEHTGLLLAFDGPLGNFRLMNDLAHAIGMVTDDIWNDVEAVRQIRNLFAHKITTKHSTRVEKQITFDSDGVKAWTEKLRLPKVALEWKPPPEPPPLTSRRKFEITCNCLEQALDSAQWVNSFLSPNFKPHSYPPAE